MTSTPWARIPPHPRPCTIHRTPCTIHRTPCTVPRLPASLANLMIRAPFPLAYEPDLADETCGQQACSTCARVSGCARVRGASDQGMRSCMRRALHVYGGMPPSATHTDMHKQTQTGGIRSASPPRPRDMHQKRQSSSASSIAHLNLVMSDLLKTLFSGRLYFLHHATVMRGSK